MFLSKAPYVSHPAVSSTFETIFSWQKNGITHVHKCIHIHVRINVIVVELTRLHVSEKNREKKEEEEAGNHAKYVQTHVYFSQIRVFIPTSIYEVAQN